MKRSEAIKLISEHVLDAIELYAANRDVKNKLFAEKILKALEKHGMSPPRIIKKICFCHDCECPIEYGWENEKE